MAVTAKVKLGSKSDNTTGDIRLDFMPDYQDGRNKEWATATPSLQLTMWVKPDVAAEHFEQGQAYTLTFEPSE